MKNILWLKIFKKRKVTTALSYIRLQLHFTINYTYRYFKTSSLTFWLHENVMILWKKVPITGLVHKSNPFISLPIIIILLCIFLIAWYISIPQFFQFWDDILIMKLYKKNSLVIESKFVICGSSSHSTPKLSP